MKAFTVLAIDTCGPTGAVALVDAGTDGVAPRPMAQTELGVRTAAAELVPAIERMLRECRLVLSELHALVVVTGPGSFTGLRVGLSTAKGLAHAVGLHVLGISRLAVLGDLAARLHPVEHKTSLLLLDAGRSEFYARQGEQERLASLDEVRSAASAGARLIVAEEALMTRLAELQPVLAAPLDAEAAVWAALPRLRAEDWDEMGTLDANYLRRSDAELFARPSAQSRP